MKKLLPLCFLIIVSTACQSPKSQVEQEDSVSDVQPNTDHHSAAITKVFDAHGGFDNWTKMKQLSYELNGQKTLVELQNRYTRIESENQTVGFDGEKVWVNPPSENADRQRMRYNLYFYFYAFPFVIGDPGISYEDVEPMEILGKTYNGVKISYGDGIGDSPKDNYIVYSDPETNQMHWLMYTATFGRDQSSDRYNLIKYDQWQELNGVIIPKVLQWYQYRNGEVGDQRNELVFENVSISQEVPAMGNFAMPEGAQVAADPN